MAKPKVKVEGDTELVRALEEARREVADLEPVHKELAGPLLNRARAEAPVLTGGLVASLYPMIGPKAMGVGSTLIYAAPIHFGWAAHNIAPNPFLIRAKDAMASEAVKGYDRYLGKVLDEVTRKSAH